MLDEEKKVKVDGEELSMEEVDKLREDAYKGKIKLIKVDEEGNELKKLDKMHG